MSNIAHTVEIKRVTGIVFRLRVLETITEVKYTDDGVTVLIESFSFTERAREMLVTGRAIKLYFLSPVEGTWKQALPITVPDETFSPYAINNFGPGKTPEDWALRKKRERLAHRVGSGRAPLDNYERVLNDPSTTKMNNFWSR